MPDRSIPQQSLTVQQDILKELEACSSAPLYHLLHKFLPAILDELREQTAVSILSYAELQKQTPLLSQILDALTSAPTLTASAPITGANMANNTYAMTVGPSQAGVITPFLADGVTRSGGVVSNTVVTFSDPSATFVLAADNVTITFTGVAASTGAVSGSVAFTVTDTDAVVSQWTDAITVTVSGVIPPQQLTQSAPIVVSAAT